MRRLIMIWSEMRRGIVEEVVTPGWMLDLGALEGRVAACRAAMADNFARWRMGYSVKTNGCRAVLDAIRRLGVMAEVVSADEWKLAREAGFEPRDIIYNGPMKDRASVAEAVRGGAVVNVECWRELDGIDEIAAADCGKEYKIGLRVRVDLDKVSPRDAAQEEPTSRFGFGEAGGDLAEALRRINAMPGVRLAGLHLHRSTRGRHVDLYRKLVGYASDVIARYGLRLDYLDLGGGYGLETPGKPSFGQYFGAIGSELQRHGLQDLEVIVEPGTAVVAGAFSLVTSVIDVKHGRDGSLLVTTDGSQNDLDIFYRRNDFKRDIIYGSDPAERSVVPLQLVCGCTCLEQDRITRLVNSPALMPGDKILWRNVGAYTLSLSSDFIRRRPTVYVLHDGRLTRSE